MKRVGPVQLSIVLVLLLGSLTNAIAQGGVCAKVVIQIDQSAVLSHTVFHAGLGIDNLTPNLLENVGVSLEIQDQGGHVVSGLFDILGPDLVGIGNLSGAGQLAPGAKASAVWSIWPTDEAAVGAVPGKPVTYLVSGFIHHVQNGTPFDLAISPVPIEVLPQPKLHLDYYLQTTVYSDNPFTSSIVELAEPFSLGLRVRNSGAGEAKQVAITSAQPVFKENEKGLALSIKILGSQVNTQSVSPSLKVAFGDIGPGASAVARWVLTSTLQGEFEDLKVDFTHVSATGQKDVSLIDSVAIHPLVHTGLIAGPEVPVNEVDALPDFLVDDPNSAAPTDPLTGKEMTDFPSDFHSSTGSILSIVGITNATVGSAPSLDDTAVPITVEVGEPGWHYIRFNDPGAPGLVLVQAARTGSGGPRASLPVGGAGDIVNVWATARPVDLNGDLVPDVTEYLGHIVDYLGAAGTYHYELVYEPAPQPWVDLGFGLAGSSGTPVLSGSGSLEPSSLAILLLSNAKPVAMAGLFVAPSNLPTSFKGGTLVPVPPLVTVVFTTSATGGITLPVTWPPGMPSGFNVYYQYAIKDPAAIHGFALSNALESTTP